jgi:hypothetical protein
MVITLNNFDRSSNDLGLIIGKLNRTGILVLGSIEPWLLEWTRGHGRIHLGTIGI